MLINLPAPPQPNGLGLLGQTLLQAATDYAAQKRQTDREAELRAQHLQDVGSERAYQDTTFDKIRNLQLSDEQRRRFEHLSDEEKKALLVNRLKMLDEAQGRGLLSPSDRGNQQVEDNAIKELTAQLAKEASLAQQQPGNAQQYINQMVARESDLQKQLSDLDAAASQVDKVSPVDIRARAEALAQQNIKPGLVDRMTGRTPKPSETDIAAQLDPAKQELQQRADALNFQRAQDIKIRRDLLVPQLIQIREGIKAASQTFRMAPQGVPDRSNAILQPGGFTGRSFTQGTGQSMVPNGVRLQPPPAANPVKNFTDTLPTNPPSASGAAAAGPSPSDVTTALRIAPPSAVGPLRQTRTSMLADQYKGFDAPPTDTAVKLAAVQQQLATLQNGQPSAAPIDLAYTKTGIPPPQEDPGVAFTRLLQQQAALQKQLRDEQQARSQQKQQALLSALQANSATGSAPVLPPSPGLAISDPYAGLSM